MKYLGILIAVFLTACAHSQPTDVAEPFVECASRFEVLENRYCAFQRAETAGETLPESLGTLTQDSAMFVAECGQDHPDFETACDGR